MNPCRHSEMLLGKLIGGALAPDEARRLDEHARTCEACRGIMELHREMMAVGGAVSDPDESELREMRTGVLAEIARRRIDAGQPGFWMHAMAFLRAQPAGAALAVLAVLVAGVLAGRWSTGPEPSGNGADRDPLLAAIERQAAATGDAIAGYWDAPLDYANVSARATGDGQLALSFDVSRHVELEIDRDSRVARDVLLHAILDASSMGARFRAMAIGQQTMDPGLREAVVFALHNDPNLAVRRQALVVLARYPFDDAVRDALVETIRQDPAVQMRLDALEHLAALASGPDAFRRTVEAAGLEDDAAVERRAVELMQQL